MTAFEKVSAHRLESEKIPKNNKRLMLFIIGILVALAAAVLMIIGFADAGIVAPEETEGPAPEIVVPGTLPD